MVKILCHTGTADLTRDIEKHLECGYVISGYSVSRTSRDDPYHYVILTLDPRYKTMSDAAESAKARLNSIMSIRSRVLETLAKTDVAKEELEFILRSVLYELDR